MVGATLAAAISVAPAWPATSAAVTADGMVVMATGIGEAAGDLATAGAPGSTSATHIMTTTTTIMAMGAIATGGTDAVIAITKRPTHLLFRTRLRI